MSRNFLVEKLITNVVRDSKIVGSSKKTNYRLSKKLLDFNGQLLSFSSYNPDFKTAGDLIGNSFEYDIETSSISLNKQLCLIPKRDTKYLTFKDTYYILFKDRNFMNSFILSNNIHTNKSGTNIILTNDEVRLKLKPETALQSFLDYYINIRKLTSKDISSVNDIIDIHNIQLQPILDNSLLLWNYPTGYLNETSMKVKDMFWYYKIKNCLILYNDLNGENSGTTLHYLSFENSFERNKFKSNLHGTILQNGKKLLIETL
ncbi:hypothetical protein RI543_004508 [Arxiozyma heterogenica]|uniref:Uncharacterized protein n=1 Tax=Arxiozyma heterogenica TaxID=278026 RepID=A0AAN7WH22_9SACH|nr:hypothetical protein RI543_004508 [Kazachstania heterogenica]